MAKNRTPIKAKKVGEINLPEGFKKEMKSLLGEEADQLLKTLEEEPVVSVRLNRRKPVSHTLFEGMEAVDWCENGFYLPERPDFGHNPLLYAGTFYVQEASSMIYEQITGKLLEEIERERGKKEPLEVLDLCAAPGGKSTAIINALDDEDVLISNEFDRKRAWILKENIEKWGSGNVVVTNNAAADFGKLSEKFDIIAVDAPCSGEGMMRREAVARSQWSEELVAQCSTLQREIVADILPTLKEGGYLIYSTCTFNRKENEENLDYFMKAYGLEPVSLKLEGVEDALKGIGTEAQALRFMPHRTKGEGLFVAVLKKPGKEEARVQPKLSTQSRKEEESQREEIRIGDILYEMSGTGKEMVKTLQNKVKNIRILSAGRPKTEMKGKLEIPLAASVLFHLGTGNFPIVDLTKEDALKYLRRETLNLPEETPKGYLTVSYKGHPLGVIKNLGNRANNLYPSEWKIRN